MKKLIIILTFLLTACAGSGSIDWNQARKIKAGMDKQEVVQLMGQPYGVTSRGNGQQTYTWVHVNGFSGGSQSMALNFKDGKVVQALEIPDTF